MTSLYIIGALMALVATLFVALPLLRGVKQNAAPAQDAANVAIYSDQLAELENDLKNGLLTQAQFDHAKPELERRLLQDVSTGGTAAPAAIPTSPPWFGILVSIIVPVCAIGFYFLIGKPEAIDVPVMAQQSEDPQQQQIEAMLPQIEQRLKEQPDDIAAWTMLGRVMMSLQRFPEAAQAYEKITQITPQSAQAFADYADSLGMVQDQKLAGKPSKMIAKALQLDPNHPKALYLAGFASIELGDMKTAIALWEKLLAQLPPEQKGVDTLREKIAELRQQAGMSAPTASAPASKPKPAAAAAKAAVSGQARLNPALKNFANPEDTVFIFARAVSGPRMPLAMLRIKAKDLPVEFDLDESMGMSPQMKLSDFPEVVIVARVSKASSAIAQPGDLEGVSAPVKLGTRNVKVEISRKIE